MSVGAWAFLVVAGLVCGGIYGSRRRAAFFARCNRKIELAHARAVRRRTR